MLDIRYEDEALLIVNKPPGILVHPTVQEDHGALSTLVKQYYEKNGWPLGLHPVSRLDRQTSGLVVFAKFPEIQGALIKQGMQKEYLALVTGTLPARHGIIDSPIARKPGSIIEREINPEGKPCKTEYWVVASRTGQNINGKKADNSKTEMPSSNAHQETCDHNDTLSLVRCRLHTGRTHQIRVHFASIGCPLWHDNLYGKIPGPPLRHGLHAYKIAFDHPWTHTRLKIVSLLPDDLQQAWERNIL